MTTYHLSICKSCDSYAGMETFSRRDLQLDSEQDFFHAKQLCENRQNMAGFWKQTVLPIRTNRASDLFFPTLMNMVMKTKKCSENFFAVIGALIWDLATLPIRLVTFLPRMAYNGTATPAEHPLIPYLKSKGLSSSDVEGTNGAQAFRNWNGNDEVCSLEKDGRVNISLYKKEIQEGRVEELKGETYVLYITDREIAFPIYEGGTFFSRNSLDGNPLPEFAE